MKRNFFNCILFFWVLSINTYSQFGFVRDLGDGLKNVAREVGNVYQVATKPVSDAADYVYSNTLKRPVDHLRSEVENQIPPQMMDLWRSEIDGRLGPYIQSVIDVGTGDKNIVNGVDDIVQHTIDQAKELIMFPELMAIYSTALALSERIPDSHLNSIQPQWQSCTSREFHKDEVRYLVSPELINSINSILGNQGSNKIDAFTLYKVIIFKNPIGDSPNELSLVGHEMVHVAQYFEKGFSPFLANYIAEILKYGYNNAPSEREAYQVQSKLYSLLQGKIFDFPTASNSSDFTEFQTPSMITLGAFEAMDVNPSGYILAKLNYPDCNLSKNDIEGLVGLAFSHPGLNEDQRSAICRSIATGPYCQNFTIIERLNWVQLAVQYNPQASINWYFLASIASQMNNQQVEYDALISLTNIMLTEELNKPVQIRNNDRILNACAYLDRAVYLGNQMRWNYNRFFDTRMPLLMLTEVGLNLPVNLPSDLQMIQYAKQAFDMDAELSSKDNIHFQIIWINAEVCLRFAANSSNLQIRRNHAIMAMQFCDIGFSELQNYRPISGQYEQFLWDRFSQIRAIAFPLSN
jgi:hypothetical protein